MDRMYLSRYRPNMRPAIQTASTSGRSTRLGSALRVNAYVVTEVDNLDNNSGGSNTLGYPEELLELLNPELLDTKKLLDNKAEVVSRMNKKQLNMLIRKLAKSETLWPRAEEVLVFLESNSCKFFSFILSFFLFVSTNVSFLFGQIPWTPGCTQR